MCRVVRPATPRVMHRAHPARALFFVFHGFWGFLWVFYFFSLILPDFLYIFYSLVSLFFWCAFLVKQKIIVVLSVIHNYASPKVKHMYASVWSTIALPQKSEA